jgi:hypothetical protein
MKIYTNTQLQKDFMSVFERSMNQTFIIESALVEVLDFVNNIPTYKKFGRIEKPNSINKGIKILKLDVTDLSRARFNEAFKEYMITGSFAPVKQANDTEAMFEHQLEITKQAIELAEYYKWLNEFNAMPSKKAKQTVSLNHEQKLLALYYLGLDTQKYDNTKCANILASIINLSIQNTREHLTYLYSDGIDNPVRNKKNLEKVLQQFESQGLTEIVDKIKLDIQNVK